MRSRRPSPEHADAVSRRLAELSAQLDASREPTAAASRPVMDPLEGGLDLAVGDEWWSDHTRVAQRRPLSVVPPVVEEVEVEELPVRALPRVSPALPVPGRHAARRPRPRASDLVPEPLQGRVRLGSGQLTAVAVLVALGLALTCWWVVWGDPEAPVAIAIEQSPGTEQGALLVPSTEEDEAPALAAPTAPPPGAGEGSQVIVDVAGKVRHPGIVVLESGARVVDALEQAGGARVGVDLTSLNLARLLVDGEQIVVGLDRGAAAATQAPAPAPAPGGAAAPTTLVDLNLADQALLETLPQVGPVTATAIIAWRTEHGAFTAVTELLEVDGIGDATLAELTPYVTV